MPERDWRADPREGDVICGLYSRATPRVITSVHPDGVECSPTRRRGSLGGATRSSFIFRDRLHTFTLVAEAGPKVDPAGREADR